MDNNSMLKCKPYKQEEKIKDFRIEDTGCSFETIKFPILGKIRLNKVAKEILEQCDGSKTIKEIIDDLFLQYEIPKDIDIYQDIDRTLTMLYRLEVINMDENYILKKYSSEHKEYNFEYVSYEETRSWINDSKEYCISTVEEEVQLLSNEDAFQLLWNSYVLAGFQILDKKNQSICKMIVRPNIDYCLFDIVFFQLNDLKINKKIWDEFLNFIITKFIDEFGAKREFIADNKVIYQYKSCSASPIYDRFINTGTLSKEVNEQDIHIYSYGIETKCGIS